MLPILSSLFIHVDERVFPKTLYTMIIIHLLSIMQRSLPFVIKKFTDQGFTDNVCYFFWLLKRNVKIIRLFLMKQYDKFVGILV